MTAVVDVDLTHMEIPLMRVSFLRILMVIAVACVAATAPAVVRARR